MSTLNILLEQIALFVIYIAVGVILVRTRVLNSGSLDVVSRLVVKLALPVMIFINSVSGVDRSTLISALPVLLPAAAMFLLLFLMSLLLIRLFRLTGDRAQVFKTLCMFGNVGFMGIPIITSIFPETGMLYISLISIIDQGLLWTAGSRILMPVGSGKGNLNWRKLINPAVVAILLALLVILTGITLPSVLDTALQKIGACATPLAMIYLGGVFACMDIRRYLGRIEYYAVVVAKQCLFPILFYLLLGLFPLAEEIRITVSLLSGMPGMSSIVMIANAQGSDGEYALGDILVTTVCSIATLPLIYWMMGMIG